MRFDEFLGNLAPKATLIGIKNKELVQGGIALTNPPCNKKQTSGLTEKALSVYQTNCEMAVVKAAL